MLEPSTLAYLRRGNNLLAFSGGVDSSALFHLLIEHGIAFDIALVNYRVREAADAEETFAKTLARTHRRRCHVRRCVIEQGNFEKEARSARYDFFAELARQEGYAHLITAHQLGDMTEWLLMQLCRGAGCVELVGMRPVEERDAYVLLRPLLFTPKASLLAYLQRHNHRYFVDTSNADPRLTRNRFRQQFGEPLLAQYAEGIARSFRYLLQDADDLLPPEQPVTCIRALCLFVKPGEATRMLRQIDRHLKRSGYLLSRAQKEEILRVPSSVIGGVWCIEITDRLVWIAPFVQEQAMPKPFRETCRVAGIPVKVRPYLFNASIDPLALAACVPQKCADESSP